VRQPGTKFRMYGLCGTDNLLGQFLVQHAGAPR
jgi:hypothetical protein